MAFKVEDGTGMIDSNSLASVAEFDAFDAASLYPSGVTDLAKKQTALMMATRVVCYAWAFNGYRGTTEQALDWPRYGVPRHDVPSHCGIGNGLGLGYYWNSEVYWPSDEIPKPLKDAIIQAAQDLIKADRTQESDSKGIKSMSLGQGAISVTFDKDDRSQVLSEQVETMLCIFGHSAACSSSAPVERT